MPRVSGLGVDTVRCSRFRRFLEQDQRAVIDRLFDEEEQAYALAKKDPAPYLAVRSRDSCPVPAIKSIDLITPKGYQ